MEAFSVMKLLKYFICKQSLFGTVKHKFTICKQLYFIMHIVLLCILLHISYIDHLSIAPCVKLMSLLRVPVVDFNCMLCMGSDPISF